MKAVAVTIGRNIEDSPMDEMSWFVYVERVRKVIEDVTAEMWVDASYQGLWEGSSEDAWVFYGPLTDDPMIPDVATANENYLKERLGQLAKEFSQDAIGLMVGDSVLVEPVPAYVQEMVS